MFRLLEIGWLIGETSVVTLNETETLFGSMETGKKI